MVRALRIHHRLILNIMNKDNQSKCHMHHTIRAPIVVPLVLSAQLPVRELPDRLIRFAHQLECDSLLVNMS
jgi:hypothetical protein